MNPTTYQSLRQGYFTVKKKYKRLVKKMHKEYKNNILKKINTSLRTLAQKSSNGDNFTKLLLLIANELLVSEIQK